MFLTSVMLSFRERLTRFYLNDLHAYWALLAAYFVCVGCSATSGFRMTPPIGSGPEGFVAPHSGVTHHPTSGLRLLRSDFVEVFSAPSTWRALGVGFLGGLALDEIGFEDSSAAYFDRNSLFPASADRSLKTLGNGATLLGGAGLWYLGSKAFGDGEASVASSELLRSLTVTGISTLGLKVLFNDERPRGGNYGYPSGHTSMGVAAATSIWHSMGPRYGWPAAILATGIAIQRLDSRAHDLDDVIGGAVLGWTVASSIAGDQLPRAFGAQVVPIVDGSGGVGVSLHWSF